MDWSQNLGLVCLSLAILVACLNFYFSFIHPLYFLLRKQKCKFVSGLPGIGTILLVVAILLLPKTMSLGGLALLLIVVDTGGFPWFVVIMAWQSLSQPKSEKGRGEN
jgi:hypothetical protein